jgi:hypothetical protein
MTQSLGSYPFTQSTECSTTWVIEVGQYGSQGPLLSQNSVEEDLTPTQSFEDSSDFPLNASLGADEEVEGYYLPVLRYPPISDRCDTAFFDANLNPTSVHGSQEIFIDDQSILKKHVMRYIDCGPYPATTKVVAIALNGKHIVWQQAIRSCAPTAISMLALDRGKPFLAKEITYAVTNNEVMIGYILKAGFNPVVHPLKGIEVEKAQALEKIIATTGPGLLHIQHPNLASHTVVLDEISLAKWRVTLREPYHGYMITISLFPFINWIGEEFIECAEPQNF